MPVALVVDDKPDNLYILATLLEAKGFVVLTASNGQAALEAARRRPPDIAVSDILMPVMDGFSLCRQWKKEERLRSIPFVFYTATCTDPGDEEFALGLGADLFVIKPKDPEELLRLIQGALKAGQTAAAAGASSAVAAGTPAAAAAAPSEEVLYLQEYNQTLIRKLEAKVVQLEETNKALAVKEFAIASAISGILLVDLRKRLTYVNTSSASLWGYQRDEMAGMDAAKLFADADAATRLFAALENEGNWIGEAQARRADGTVFIVQMAAHLVVDSQGDNVCFMASCVDVTEQKRTRDDIQRSQRMESLSLFAAGIAHDFNNLLTSLFVGIGLIKEEIPPSTQAEKHFAVVMSAFSRARDLTQRLLAFAKGGAPVRKKLVVSDIVKESCALALSGSRIRHDIVVDNTLWLMEADANQLSQVFNNIVINARQAMGDHGTLTITVRNRALNEREGALQPGEYVEIVFRDDGPGIPPDALPRIFDPFFTTKAEGSGLGLATSHAILKNHGGHIHAASPPGGGASIHVWLPALSGLKPGGAREVLTDRKHGVGRVLLMDDERNICDLARFILARAGYDVSTVSNGQEAVLAYRKAAEARHPFDLVILDITICGGMGGEDTLAALRAVDPRVAAIASTGYSDALMRSRMQQLGFLGMLPKPYLEHDLLSAVKAVIDRDREQDGRQQAAAGIVPGEGPRGTPARHIFGIT